jgi:hypothetical protein
MDKKRKKKVEQWTAQFYTKPNSCATKIEGGLSRELIDCYEISISQMPMSIFPFTKITISIIGIYYA